MLAAPTRSPENLPAHAPLRPGSPTIDPAHLAFGSEWADTSRSVGGIFRRRSSAAVSASSRTFTVSDVPLTSSTRLMSISQLRNRLWESRSQDLDRDQVRISSRWIGELIALLLRLIGADNQSACCLMCSSMWSATRRAICGVSNPEKPHCVAPVHVPPLLREGKSLRGPWAQKQLPSLAATVYRCSSPTGRVQGPASIAGAGSGVFSRARSIPQCRSRARLLSSPRQQASQRLRSGT